MPRYLTILRGYSTDDHLARSAPGSPVLAAWLTGQSSHRHSQLSPGQHAVLDDLEELGYGTVRGGFPYNWRSLTLPYSPEPLVRASVRNAGQLLAALASPAYAAELARHLQPLVDAAPRRLLLLCGSCGLELLAAAWPRLAWPADLRLSLLAVGPVGWTAAPFFARPGLDLFVVRGSRDWISRLGSRLAADLHPPADHLGYTRPEARQAIREGALTLAGR